MTDYKDFGTICICAVQNAMPRETYIPTLVQGYIKSHIQEIDTRALSCIVRDIKDAEVSEFPRALGNPKIDRPGWIEFREYIEKEIEKRGKHNESCNDKH